MEHQAEVNRLTALKKLKVSQPPPPTAPGSNTIYYRTFRAPANPPEETKQPQQERHFFPDSMQVEAMMSSAESWQCIG